MSSRAKFIILGLVVLYLLVALAECKTRKKHVQVPAETHKAAVTHETTKEMHSKEAVAIKEHTAHKTEHATVSEGGWEEYQVTKLVKERETLIRKLHQKEQEQRELIKKYQALLRERDNQIAELKAKLSKLQEKMPSELKAELKAAKKKIITLEKALAETKAHAGIDKLQAEISKLKAELANKTKELSKCKEALSAKEMQIKKLQQIVDKSGLEVKKALQLAQEKEARLLAQLKAAKQEIAKLKKQLAAKSVSHPVTPPMHFIKPAPVPTPTPAPAPESFDLNTMQRELERAKAQLKAKEYILEKAQKEMEELREGIKELSE